MVAQALRPDAQTTLAKSTWFGSSGIGNMSAPLHVGPAGKGRGVSARAWVPHSPRMWDADVLPRYPSLADGPMLAALKCSPGGWQKSWRTHRSDKDLEVQKEKACLRSHSKLVPGCGAGDPLTELKSD